MTFNAHDSGGFSLRAIAVFAAPVASTGELPQLLDYCQRRAESWVPGAWAGITATWTITDTTGHGFHLPDTTIMAISGGDLISGDFDRLATEPCTWLPANPDGGSNTVTAYLGDYRTPNNPGGSFPPSFGFDLQVEHDNGSGLLMNFPDSTYAIDCSGNGKVVAVVKTTKDPIGESQTCHISFNLG